MRSRQANGTIDTPVGRAATGGSNDPLAPVREAFDPLREALSEVPSPFGDLIAATVVLIVGWYASKALVRSVGPPIARRFRRPSVTRTVLRGIRSGVLAITLLVVVSFFGLQPPDILLSVTVFSAVLGVVLAPIVGSIINGVFVIADQPYEIGDMIELVERDRRGFVDDITLRYTKIVTLDNTFIVIPNSSIRDRDVINYSAEDERTRLALAIVVTYEGDVDAARSTIERATRGVEEVVSGGPDIRIGPARYPAAPTCYIDGFGDHGIRLRLRYWAKQPYKLLTIRSKVQTAVRDALDDVDVEIAYPHSHVVFDETSGEAAVTLRNANGSGRRARDGAGDPTRGDRPDPAKTGDGVDPDAGPDQGPE
ncbi:mechanosensitive ion channel family protein [Halobacteriales archaeon SW_7_68_16]|nr:MAG: mechanosensitive ion channel family protein [Halobacteriales archaeon SW_7_68_16]